MTNLKSLFAAVLLIVAGLISPSNGVDDRSYKSPLDIFMTLLAIVIVATFIYLVWSLFEKQSEPSQSENNERNA